jgi:hypothetical protein
MIFEKEQAGDRVEAVLVNVKNFVSLPSLSRDGWRREGGS